MCLLTVLVIARATGAATGVASHYEATVFIKVGKMVENMWMFF